MDKPLDTNRQTIRKTITKEKHNSARRNENLPQWLREQEVAEITGFSLSTLRNDRFLGQNIPYFKFKKSVRYLLTDVTAWMLQHRIATEDK